MDDDQGKNHNCLICSVAGKIWFYLPDQSNYVCDMLKKFLSVNQG